MSKAFALALLAAAFTQAAAQLPSPQDLPKALAAAIARNEELAKSGPADAVDSYNMDGNYQAPKEQDLLTFAVPLSFAKPEGTQPGPYRQALVEALGSTDAATRGLACWVAGHCCDLELLPRLGSLLDDAEPSLALPGGMPQQAASCPGGTRISMVRPTVSALARGAIAQMIGISFASRADFNTWAANSRPIQLKQWYWASKWGHRWDDRLAQIAWRAAGGAGRTNMPKIAFIDSEFDSVPAERALQVLAAQWGEPNRGLRLDLGVGTDVTTRSSARELDATFRPDSEEIAAYVVRHKLAGRLMAALEDPSFRGGPPSEDALSMALMAARVGRYVFGAGDDTRLARCQAQIGIGQVGESIAITRSCLSPNKGAAILADYVAIHLDAGRAARELASRFGSQSGEVLVAYFQRADGSDRTAITDELRQAAARHVAVSSEFLLKLTRVPATEKDARQDDSLANIAVTANLVLGREAIGPVDIEAARYKRGKLSHDELEALNAGRPEALARLKGLLEEVLSG